MMSDSEIILWACFGGYAPSFPMTWASSVSPRFIAGQHVDDGGNYTQFIPESRACFLSKGKAQNVLIAVNPSLRACRLCV